MKSYHKWLLLIALLGSLNPLSAAAQAISDIQQELPVLQELQDKLEDLQDIRELQRFDGGNTQLGPQEFVQRPDKGGGLDPKIVFDSLGPDKMVLPGIMIDDPSRFKEQCQGRLCGIGFDGPFNGNVDYERRAHDEVLLLLYQYKGEAEWTPHCSSVAIAPRYALTALHCFGSAGEIITKNFSFEKSAINSWVIGNPTGRTKFAASVGGSTNPAQYIPIKRIMIPYKLKALPAHPKPNPPHVDLALVEFGSDIRGLPLVAKLGALDLAEKEPISFAGYGLTNVSTEKGLRYAAFNQVRAKVPRYEVSYVAWISDEESQKGGPCLGDSGGPIYRGFERGFADDPNTVIAIVSHFRRRFDINQQPMKCVGELGYAVRLDRFVKGICTLSNRSPQACQ
jgi:hypothetical protein